MSSFPTTKEEVKHHLDSFLRPITLQELADILGTTIKHDVTNKTIGFLGMLLTYTEADQMNIAFNAESSSGKSYIPLELAHYFPDEDVMEQGYTSPTAFFHEYGSLVGMGVYIEGKDGKEIELQKKVIDLSKKILIFIDQPHDMVLQRLRPLLSHDRKKILHKITDRSRKHSRLQTQSIELVGFPTVIFCSTKFSLEDQERTRLLLLSPEITPEKIIAGIELLSEKLANRKLFKKWMEEDPGRCFLMARVSQIKQAGIKEVVIEDKLREQIFHRFKAEHPNPIPRHQRDFPRLIGFIKAHALLNLHQRERFEDNLLVKEEDVREGYKIYNEVSESNEMGIPPEIYLFYNKVVIPIVDRMGMVSRKDLAKAYYDIYHKVIGRKRLKNTLDILLETGLIMEDWNPDNRREKIYMRPHVAGHILQDEGDKPDEVPVGKSNRLMRLPEVIKTLSNANEKGDWVSEKDLRKWLERHWKTSWLEVETLLGTAINRRTIYNPTPDTWAVT